MTDDSIKERWKRFGIIDEASTLIERRPDRPSPDRPASEDTVPSDEPVPLDRPIETTRDVVAFDISAPGAPDPAHTTEPPPNPPPPRKRGTGTVPDIPVTDVGPEDMTEGFDSREIQLQARRLRAKSRAHSSPKDVLHRAKDTLPAIEVPPHAERILEKSLSQLKRESVEESTAPRIGEYALVARFPSSQTADVFLGYKVSNFGFIRRAVVKWTDRHRYDYEIIRQKLLDEARAISFVDHPNIVTILDLDEDELGTYLALEYVAGTDLRRVMVELGTRNDRIPLEHACYTMLEVLRGLSHVHRAHGPDGQPLTIIHRDVNPSNILISEDGHVKLTDFGTVLMDGRFQDSTAPGTVKGKVRYLAPEYITDQVCTHHVDIYGVGVMLFELLTGHPCFLARDETVAMFKIVKEGIPLLELKQAGVPPQLQAIVEHATMRDYTKRFSTAVEMCIAMEDWMSAAGVFVSPTRFSTYLGSHGLLG